MPSPPDPGPLPCDGPGLLSRYHRAPLATRVFLRLRWAWTPYPQIAARVPWAGKVLDGGCGHGLLSLVLALGSRRRKVTAIDLSPFRLELARQAAEGLPHLRFLEGDFTDFAGRGFSALVFLDVLHYLRPETHGPFLRLCHARLRKGGILLFREVERRPGLSSFLNRCHEWAMTRLGLTRASVLHFRSPTEWEDLARQAGFRVERIPQRRFPFSDLLFVCRKNRPFRGKRLTK